MIHMKIIHSWKRNFSTLLIIVLAACSGSSDSTPIKKSESTPAYDPQPICTAGTTISCSSLASLWASGTATCASDRFSYDVSSCVRVDPPNPEDLVVETVYPAQRDDRWKNAKCNLDGDFVFQIWYPKNPDGTWIIQLEGGGFCGFDGNHNGDGDGSCSTRESFKLHPIKSNYDVFDLDRTVGRDLPLDDDDWGNTIVVKANYCSSDLWTGTNTDGFTVHYEGDPNDPDPKFQVPITKKWPFTGHINFDAMMDILKERYGLDDNNSKIAIHMRGQSAGGWGVINNAADMKARYPQVAARGNLMLSAWEGYIPQYWDNKDYPVFGVIDPTQGPWSEPEAFEYLANQWKSKLYEPCTLVHPNHPSDCLFGNVMYDYITGSEAVAGLDLPLFVYQNRQDQLYMSLLFLPFMSSAISDTDLAARGDFVDQMNAVMGIPGENKSNKIKWLYAPSDPDVDEEGSPAEPNVHPPLCYEFDSPEGADKSVDEMTRRFWHTRGKGPGRGKLDGEVITWNVNFVTNVNGPSCE